MFGDGFQEGTSAEIPIHGTSGAAFKALLTYLYTDILEVEEAVLFDLARLSDQYRVERLHSHCLHRLFRGLTVQNAVTRLVQAHGAASGSGEGCVWSELEGRSMRYVARHLEEMLGGGARATVEELERTHPGVYRQVLAMRSGRTTT